MVLRITRDQAVVPAHLGPELARLARISTATTAEREARAVRPPVEALPVPGVPRPRWLRPFDFARIEVNGALMH